MELSLKNRSALVGGASKGIGYAIAHLLAKEGASIAMVARHEEPLEEAANRIRSETGATVYTIKADIRQANDCQKIIDVALEKLSRKIGRASCRERVSFLV